VTPKKDQLCWGLSFTLEDSRQKRMPLCLGTIAAKDWFDNEEGKRKLESVLNGSRKPKDQLLAMGLSTSFACDIMNVFNTSDNMQEFLSRKEKLLLPGLKQKITPIDDRLMLKAREIRCAKELK
ncbi:hypothetical protein KI387_042803, partial [Taxus chinensis]